MLVDCHSEKELAAPNFKGGFGFHLVLAWLDNTHEALAGRLRPGNAGANTAADHIAVLDDALAQIPDEHRYGVPLLVRADGAGASKEFLTHIRSLQEQGIQAEFSVGFTMTEKVHQAVTRVPTRVWTPAIESDGNPRDGAEVAELTGLLPNLTRPAGRRVCG
jgi:Transposase DDE domain group 1